MDMIFREGGAPRGPNIPSLRQTRNIRASRRSILPIN